MRHGLGFHNRHSAFGFQPISLYTGGVAGAWYDPSDYGAGGTNGVGTLFQDSAGTTPVTAVEQVVGLMLDKSQGLVLGPELVTNGDFSQGTTGWTLYDSGTGGTFNATSGQLSITGGTSFVRAIATLTTVVGRWYSASVNVTSLGVGGTVFRATTDANGGSSAGLPTVSRTSAGKATMYFCATGATTYIVGGTADNGQTTVIDDVTVRELPGNHATATGTARPTLSARVNLLTKTEQFQDAAWIKTNSTVTPNSTIAPDGTLTADTFLDVLSGPYAEIKQNQSVVSGVTYRYSVRARQGTQRYILLSAGTRFPAAAEAIFDLQTVTVKSSGAGVSSPTCTQDANGFVVCAFNVTATSSGTADFFIYHTNAAGTSVLYTGTGTGSVFIWGADLRVTNDGVNIPPYQRVNTATDYDTAGFPLYLSFAGAQAMSTPANIDFATVTSDGLARRNLLLNPTQFDAAGWTATNVTVTANSTVAPDGTTTADTITPDATNATHNVATATVGSAVTTTYSIYAKANGYNFVNLRLEGTSNFFDIATGALGTVAAGSTCSIVSAGGGWYRCIVTRTIATPAGVAVRVATADLVDSFAGNGTSGVFLWGAQLETGSTATAFQNIGTDKMLVVAGVRKLSDAATAIALELSADNGTNNGTFVILAPSSSGANSYRFNSRGTLNISAGSGIFAAAPNTSVATGIGNIGGDVAQLRINGSVIDTQTGDQGTGNYGTYPLFIGARNLSSVFLNGRVYGIVIAGSQYSDGQVSATEAYMNTKTRAY